MTKYRIREINRKYTIEIYSYEYVGCLWWRRKEYRWYTTTDYGGVWAIDLFQLPVRCSPIFRTLEDAQKQIDDWNEEPKYHTYP